MSSVYVYLRYSPRPDETGANSLERQKRECKVRLEEILSGGATGYRYYIDENASGGTMKRTVLHEMLAQLQPGDVVVASSLDRLARGMEVYCSIMGLVRAAGATVEFADGTTPEDTPEGRLIGSIFAAFAAYERDRTVTRTKKAMDRKREEGKIISGKIPIGYEADPEKPGHLRVYECERDAIIEACGLRFCEEQYRWGQVAGAINAEYGGRLKAPWSAQTARRMVKKHSWWAWPNLKGDGVSGYEYARDRMPKHPK